MTLLPEQQDNRVTLLAKEHKEILHEYGEVLVENAILKKALELASNIIGESVTISVYNKKIKMTPEYFIKQAKEELDVS